MTSKPHKLPRFLVTAERVADGFWATSIVRAGDEQGAIAAYEERNPGWRLAGEIKQLPFDPTLDGASRA